MLVDASLPLFLRLLDQLPTGVVLLDGRGRVVHYNRAEEKLAGRLRERTLGLEFFVDVAPCMNVREMGGLFYDGIGRTELSTRVEFAFPFPQLDRPRDVVVERRSFEFEGAPYGCLFVEDVSAQRTIERLRENLGQMLVHDLKNPLSVIMTNLGYVDTKLGATLAGQEVGEALADAGLAARRLHSMLLTMLDVARLETQTMPIRLEMVDLRALAGAAVEATQSLARARRIDLVALLPATAVAAAVDADLLRRALDNLLENAIRYARRRVSLAVLERAPGRVELAVTDDGPGVPAALREAIFEKHVQVEGAGQPRSDNRGLGLTFVRMVARGHGGDARCELTPGGGSAFVMELASAGGAPTPR